MRIPRCVVIDDPVTFELHGFSDASQRAYGCCIYLRKVNANGMVDVKLICGKSRVAPLKELKRPEYEGASPCEMTIPRLELCAAALLAEQLKTEREALELEFKHIVLRSDSKIVLCWLKKQNSDFPVFVRNRIVEIQKFTPDAKWLYIGTKDNPADLVSRGVQPVELMKSELWWNGPVFLSSLEEEFEIQHLEEKEESDDVNNTEKTVALVAQECRLYNLIQNCSNFRGLSGSLAGRDHRDSLLAMVKIVQHVVYEEEIKDIEKGKLVKGKLRNLNPMYDKREKLLRVGGRTR
ncbi:uncharacterized protein LOC129719771 [Wyeomyia smithii]|uniref:uncharacterized protein LOC129719771 n=1 Tax=Wyeomyia smithii TaxID=174621 RepID=UPI0024680027|nr:uncharacterized protein LOC129719771 [Wyeomyia smithii]